MPSDISVNANAVEIVQRMMDRAEELVCQVIKQENGSVILDAGVNVAGSPELGRLIAEACMGGLAAIRNVTMHIEDMTLPGVVVSTKHPVISTLGSQYAGWQLKLDDFFAMASGPARALYAHEKVFKKINYADHSHSGVLVLETRTIPSEGITSHIATLCQIDPSELYIIVVPTASIAGSIQISARIVEVGIHKMWKLKFDVTKVRSANGTAPVAPVAKNDMKAMGRTNDCILYGGRAYYFIRPDETDNLASFVQQLPSIASEQYGLPFYDLFKSFKYDFYKVDPLLFSPAEVTLNDILTREIYRAGSLNPDVLRKSLGI